MAKPQPKPTRLQKMAAQKNKVLTGPKGSKPQSTTNARSTKPSPKASIPSTTKAKPAAKPAAKPKAPTPKPQASSSMKADAQRFQQLNQSASARAGKAAEPKPTPRTPAPGTGNVVRTAIEYGQKYKEAQRQSTRSAKLAKSNYGKLMGTVAKGLGSAAMGALRKNPVVGTAAAVSAPRPTAAGTIEAAQGGRARSRFENARNTAFKKASAIKGSPVLGSRRAGSSSTAAGQFDSAFAAARKAGKSTFTFKGKKYTTKMK